MDSESPILLCERCGYPLGGLGAAAACPECGKALGESLPSRRVGSAWQRGPGVVAWCRTAWGFLRRPVGSWREVRLERGRSAGLLAVNIGVGSGLVSTVLIGMPFRSPSGWYVASFASATALVLSGLTLVEFVGMRLFGSRRGYRTTRTAALAIAGHASVGWVVAGVLVAAGARVLYGVGALWNGSMGFRGGVNVGVITAGVVMAALFSMGMVVFSMLCGAGMHALRYANR